METAKFEELMADLAAQLQVANAAWSLVSQDGPVELMVCGGIPVFSGTYCDHCIQCIAS